MIITKTPFRMSFFGGGTDIKDYFEEYGGAVLSTTFDKYCYVNVRHLPRFFDYSSEFVYSHIERITDDDFNSMQHPLIRNACKMLYMKEIRLSYEADLPARSGLGTSSSFAVGMLNAFHVLKKDENVTKEQLAKEAIYLERELCQEAGGWQDQIAAAYGGFNRIDFDAKGFSVTPLVISVDRKQKLNDRLMMFFTGFTRLSSEIQSSNRPEDKKKQLAEMYKLVGEAEGVLTDEAADLNEFGQMLDYTWQLKKQTGSKVSTGDIDMLYEKGIKAGAIGGKLLGAGGGGFLVFYVPEEKQNAVRNAMNGLIEIPFQFENDGSTLAYYAREPYENK